MLVVYMRVGLRSEWLPYNLRIVDKFLGTSRRDGLTRTLACTLHNLKTLQAKRPYNLKK